MFGGLAGMALGQMMSDRANRSSRNNPSRSAEAHLGAIPGQARPYYDPFIQRANEAYNRSQGLNREYSNLYESPGIDPNRLPNEYERMAHNPTDFMNALMERYNPSEGYKFKQKQMTEAMRNSAAAGGFAGTPFNQQQQAETVQGLLGSDMQEFLQNALGVSQAGLQGKENRLLGKERALQSALSGEEFNMNRGFNASSALADILANVSQSRASNAYSGAMRRRNDAQNRLGGWSAIGHAVNMFGQNMMPGMGGSGRGFTPPTGGGGYY